MTDSYDNDTTLTAAQRENLRAQEKAAALNSADKTYTTTSKEAEAANMNRDPITGAPGSHPVATGIGTAEGAATGAIFGSAVGPVGTLVGGVVGAVVGGLVGHGAGEEANPTPDDIYWRESYVREPYYNSAYTYEDYAPAYRFGSQLRSRSGVQIWDEQQQLVLRDEWEASRGTSRMTWEEARSPSRAAWERSGRATNI